MVDVGPSLPVTNLAHFMLVFVRKEEMLPERIVIVVRQTTLHAQQFQGVGEAVLKQLGLGALVHEADLADVVHLPQVGLEVQERGQVLLLAHLAAELGARGGALVGGWAVADMAEVGAVVKEDVLAEVALEDLGSVLRLDVRDQVGVGQEGGRGAVAAVVAILRGIIFKIFFCRSQFRGRKFEAV